MLNWRNALLILIGLVILVAIGFFVHTFSGCRQAQTGPTDGSVELTWTATGDDADRGRASHYALRYSYDSMQLKNDWGACIEVFETQEIPIPKPAGERESLTVINLPSDTVLYFRILAADEVMNWSNLAESNIATKRTQDMIHPAPITDLE